MSIIKILSWDFRKEATDPFQFEYLITNSISVLITSKTCILYLRNGWEYIPRRRWRRDCLFLYLWNWVFREISCFEATTEIRLLSTNESNLCEKIDLLESWSRFTDNKVQRKLALLTEFGNLFLDALPTSIYRNWRGCKFQNRRIIHRRLRENWKPGSGWCSLCGFFFQIFFQPH